MAVEGFEDEDKTKRQEGRQGKNSVNGFWLPLLSFAHSSGLTTGF